MATLKEKVWFSKHLHANTLEYLANAATTIDARAYEENLMRGCGHTPEVTKLDMKRVDAEKKLPASSHV